MIIPKEDFAILIENKEQHDIAIKKMIDFGFTCAGPRWTPHTKYIHGYHDGRKSKVYQYLRESCRSAEFTFKFSEFFKNKSWKDLLL